MNVLILELGNSHIECTYTFVHLLKIKKQKIHLICNQSLFDLFPMKDELDGYALVPDQFNLWTSLKTIFFLRRYVIREKIDRIIFNTTEIKIIRNFFIIMPLRAKSFGLFHNAKKLENGGTVKNIFSKRMKKYFLLGNHLKNHTQIIPGLLTYPYFPIYFPNPTKLNIKKLPNDIWITIVGSANVERRDYAGLVQYICEGKFYNNIKFVFLGKNYLPLELKKMINQYEYSRKSIILFDSIINYDLFHNYAMLSDIILPLVKLENDLTYSDQRISGSYNIGLGYKKPFLLPKNVKNIDILPFSLVYGSMDELAKIINEISTNPSLLMPVKMKYDKSELFDFKSEAQRMIDFLMIES